MLIFEESTKDRCAALQAPAGHYNISDIPSHLLRETRPILPEVSELQAVRHFTRLSGKNFAIDTNFYPLGSCTMKYNPRIAHELASSPEIASRHPYTNVNQSQGFLECLFELQEYLKAVTGMAGVSLTPMAGAQGEFAGVAMIKAYHEQRQDFARREIIVPDAAHGTNPASAVMCGYQVKEVPTLPSGDVDIETLKMELGPQTAGVMLTNPSTLGVFERKIQEIAGLVHKVGGLLYYDGANLNAILGKVRPGDMGFDVIHLNLHKTFATPHGGGGPGSGPVAASDRLKPFLPVPIVGKSENNYHWLTNRDLPLTIGQLSTFMGNAGILMRAYVYIRLLGVKGLKRVSEYATLNANYLLAKLVKAGFDPAFPKRRATHEFIITLSRQARELGVTALDFAKRLLDYGFHAPTIYFPLMVPECLLIEPTETECKQDLDAFVAAMVSILDEAKTNPELLKNAPLTMPVQRLDEVKAARDLDLTWKPKVSVTDQDSKSLLIEGIGDK
jgi:glycine dehydrogenase subunit 2